MYDLDAYSVLVLGVNTALRKADNTYILLAKDALIKLVLDDSHRSNISFNTMLDIVKDSYPSIRDISFENTFKEFVDNIAR